MRVYTEAAFPQSWAATQNNLGAAYSDVPGGDRADNLRQAIACYTAALRVYTEAAFPQDWAATKFNSGLALVDLAEAARDRSHFTTALTAFQNAERGFRAVGIVELAERAKEQLARVRKMLDSELPATHTQSRDSSDRLT